MFRYEEAVKIAQVAFVMNSRAGKAMLIFEAKHLGIEEKVSGKTFTKVKILRFLEGRVNENRNSKNICELPSQTQEEIETIIGSSVYLPKGKEKLNYSTNPFITEDGTFEVAPYSIAKARQKAP